MDGRFLHRSSDTAQPAEEPEEEEDGGLHAEKCSLDSSRSLPLVSLPPLPSRPPRPPTHHRSLSSQKMMAPVITASCIYLLSHHRPSGHVIALVWRSHLSLCFLSRRVFKSPALTCCLFEDKEREKPTFTCRYRYCTKSFKRQVILFIHLLSRCLCLN